MDVDVNRKIRENPFLENDQAGEVFKNYLKVALINVRKVENYSLVDRDKAVENGVFEKISVRTIKAP